MAASRRRRSLPCTPVPSADHRHWAPMSSAKLSLAHLPCDTSIATASGLGWRSPRSQRYTAERVTQQSRAAAATPPTACTRCVMSSCIVVSLRPEHTSAVDDVQSGIVVDSGHRGAMLAPIRPQPARHSPDRQGIRHVPTSDNQQRADASSGMVPHEARSSLPIPSTAPAYGIDRSYPVRSSQERRPTRWHHMGRAQRYTQPHPTSRL